MTSKNKIKLYTDQDLSFERVFEVRIRDLRERKGIKQKSFSISVDKKAKDEQYIELEKLKQFIESKIKEID